MDHYLKSIKEELELIDQNEKKWQNYKKELSETKTNLKEFVKSRSVVIMVPMGKKAFVRGTLQHTNELTISHGASMFSDVSTSQAIEILEHRMDVCDNRLTDLEKERNLFTNKIKLPGDTFGSSEGQEIIEEYHEEEEKNWRRKHADSIKRQKLREAQERQSSNDVDMNQLLDDYEIMEELADELETLDINDSDTLLKIMKGEMKPSESRKRVAHNVVELVEPEIAKETKTSEKLEEKNVPEINNNDLIDQNNQEIVNLLKTYRCKIKDVLKNVKKDDERNVNLFLDLIELKDDIEDDIRKMNDEDYSDSDSDEQDSDDDTASIKVEPEKTKRKVRFSTSLEDVKMIEVKSDDLSRNIRPKSNTIQINFQHSEAKFDSQQFSSEGIIVHPGEICQTFAKQLTPISARKSILKTRKSPTSPMIEEKPTKKFFEADVPVVGDVVEHQTETNHVDEVIHISNKNDGQKKISKFKQMRLMS